MTNADTSQLFNFQLDIAERWLQRGNNTSDVFFQYFCFFAGFNALYFLWAQRDDVRSGEEKQIHHLVEKFGNEGAERVLAVEEVRNATKYFGNSRPPIQRMDKRQRSSPEEGDTTEGQKWRGFLQENNNNVERLKALASILYLVRCNLVHGSKSGSGDDEQVVGKSVPALKQLLRATIELTKSEAV